MMNSLSKFSYNGILDFTLDGENSGGKVNCVGVQSVILKKTPLFIARPKHRLSRITASVVDLVSSRESYSIKSKEVKQNGRK